MDTKKVYALRVVHGLFALYFLACLVYLYYAAYYARFDILLLVAVVSLVLEGVAVFVLNKGDCPLIHIQRKIGDDKPFFELLFPPSVAKRTVPVLTALAWLAFVLLAIRYIAG